MPLVLLALIAAAQAAPPSWVPDGRFSLALYCSPTCEPELTDAIESSLAAVPTRRRLPRTAREPVRAMALAPTEELGRPQLDALGGLADGLAPEDVAALEASQEVLLASFAAPRERVEEVHRVAWAAFQAQLLAHGGVVEDLATGRLWGRDTFAAQVQAVVAQPLDVSAFFVVEATGDETDVAGTLQTYGLRALGLHDLLFEDVPAGEEDDWGALIGTVAQVAWEQGGLTERTRVTELAPVLPAARLRAVGIEGTVYATAAQSSWSASADPVARLGFEGRFDADPCQPLDAYPVDLVSAPAPGEAPAVAPVPGTEAASEVGVPSPPGVEAPLAPTGTVPSPEASLPGLPEPEAAPPDVAEPAPPAAPVGPANLAEARAQAASDLAGHVHAAWDQGLPPGDRLYVKAPFDDGTGKVEYLWVQVVAWHGALLEGVLRSVPAWSRTLAVGDVVRVQQGDLFDYLWRRADGTSEGNRTEAFLR